MKIYFVRHGETKWNQRKKLQGQVNIPLAEKGQRQAKVTAEAMGDIPFDYAFSSPLKRALVTAQTIVGDRDIPLVRDNRLMEMDFGVYDGRIYQKFAEDEKYTRFQRFFNDPAHYRAPKYGENFYDVCRRTKAFYEQMILPLEGKAENVLVAAHGCVIRSFLVNLNKREVSQFWETPFGKNCSTALFECQDGQAHMIYENKIYYEEA